MAMNLDIENRTKQYEDIINNQEIYIKQLEEKLKELKCNSASPTHSTNDKDKKLLLDLVEKNQAMILKLKQEAADDRNRHGQEIEAMKIRQQQQIEYLTQGIAKVDKTFDSSMDKDKFYSNLRQQLFDEISKVEKQGKLKSDEYSIMLNEKQNIIDRLNTEIHNLKGTVDTNSLEVQRKQCSWNNEKQEINKDYELKIESKDKHIEALQTIETNLRKEITELKQKVEELSTIKCISEVEIEARISAESKKTNGDYEEIVSNMKGEVKEKEAKIKSLDEALQTIQDALQQKYNLAINEKRMLEIKNKAASEEYLKLKEDSSNEIDSLRKQITSMVNSHSLSEAMLRDELNATKTALLESHKEYNKKLKMLTDQLTSIEEARNKMRIEVEKTHQYLKESFVPDNNLCNIQKREIESLKQSVDTKNKEIEEYRLRAFVGNNNRKNLTSTLERINNFIKNAESSDEKTLNMIVSTSNNIKQIESMHSKVEEFHMQQIKDLTEECNKLRITVKSHQEKRYDEIISTLNTENAKLKIDLSSAKEQLLIQINVMNHQIVKDVDERDAVKLREEVKRLNEENALEIKNKQQLESHYTAMVSDYNKRVIKITDDYHSILAKYTTLEDAVNNKRFEDFKLWRKRFEELKKSSAIAELKLNDITRKCNEISKFQGEKEELTNQELECLRESVKKLDKMYEAKMEDLDRENKVLKESLSINQEKSSKTDEVTKHYSSLCFSEFDSLKIERQEIKDLTQIYNSTIETIRNIEISYSNFIVNEQKDSTAKLKLLEDTYKKDTELQQKKSESMAHTFTLQIKELEVQYKDQITLLNEKLEAAEYEISSIQKELKANREALKTTELTKNNDNNKYSNEIMKLKTSYAEKQQQIKREKVLLMELIIELNKRVEKNAIENLEKRLSSVFEGIQALKTPISNGKRKAKVEEEFKELQKAIELKDLCYKEEKVDVLSLSNQLKCSVDSLGKESDIDKKIFEGELDIIRKNYMEKEKKLSEELNNIMKERDALLVKMAERSESKTPVPPAASNSSLNKSTHSKKGDKFLSKTTDIRSSALKKN